MAISKNIRTQIFNKYNGKCAYCGDPLQKGWHVDEMEPVRRSVEYKKDDKGNRIWDEVKQKYKTYVWLSHPERLTIENQNPSCPSCNINKHSLSLEEFRNLINGFMKHLNEVNTQYKIAKRYGLIQETNIEVKFYFETISTTK